MNGQTRSSEFISSKDYSQLNLVKQVQVIENYRGFKRIYYIKAGEFYHFAYLDGDFMGFMAAIILMKPKEAIDYYLDKINIIFRNPGLEYSNFMNRPEYSPYINALKFKMNLLDKVDVSQFYHHVIDDGYERSPFDDSQDHVFTYIDVFRCEYCRSVYFKDNKID